MIMDYVRNSFALKKKSEKLNQKKQADQFKQSGFTLVELIVVMLILTILITISVMGILAWQDWTRFRKNNEYAQTLFVAAQNQLSEYDSSGKIERFSKELKNGNTFDRQLDVTTLTNSEGTAYSLDTDVWYEAKDETEESQAQKYKSVLVYASCKPGDYDDFIAHGESGMSQDAKDSGAAIVFRLLQNYVYDISLLNNAISIEFSPLEGQVFAVCFSDYNEEFIYAGANAASPTGKCNISNRSEDNRYSHFVGYYGTDTLAKSTKDSGEKISLSEVKLNNEETLNLSFKILKPTGVTQSLKYKIEVHDADETDHHLILSFPLDGTKLHNYQTRSTIVTPVTAYTYDSSNNQSKIELGNYEILAWIDDSKTVRIVLDAADIEASTNQYLNDVARLTNANASEEKFAKTYSFHRFGLDAENIFCTLQASGSIYKESSLKHTNSEATYFESALLENGNDNKSTLTYEISNARHLYNVRYNEDLSITKQAQLSSKIPNTNDLTNRYTITDTVDWNTFVSEGNLLYSDSSIINIPLDLASIVIVKDGEGTTCSKYVSKSEFPSIKSLRYGNTFAGDSKVDAYQKNAKGQIVKLGISEKSNLAYDIYELEDSSTNPGLGTEIKAPKDGYAPVGLFLENKGKIANVTLDEITVSGENYVGSFCGVNSGHLIGLTINNKANETSTISGDCYIGGIMGYLDPLLDQGMNPSGNATEPVLKDLYNYAKLSGREYVGGIVGKVEIKEDNVEYPVITIEKCENYGALDPVITNTKSEKEFEKEVHNKQAIPRYIGGIVGFCDNQYKDASGKRSADHLLVKDCISAPQYTSTDLVKLLETDKNSLNHDLGTILDENFEGKNLNGVYVGGIIGYNNYATIVNCSTASDKMESSYIFGYEYVGGIVGFNQGPASGILGGKDSEEGRNSAHVVGVKYVGGITGCNSNISYVEDTVTKPGSTLLVPELDEDKAIIPDNEPYFNAKINNWLNEGIIYAKDSYAGGITGYNAGWLYNCNSQVKEATSESFFAKAYCGDYAGGIAGYNNGIIGASDRTVSEDGKSAEYKLTNGQKSSKAISTKCYISGHDYVGGIVGYNDANAIVEDYGLIGGSVLGKEDSKFVGGYAGFNASLLLLQDEDGNPHEISSNPNEVKGHYFVGGTIGGNIVNTNNMAGSALPSDYPSAAPSAVASVSPSTSPSGATPSQVPSTQPSVSNLCYAKLELQNNGQSITDDSAKYGAALDLHIYNNTNKKIVSWAADFSAAQNIDFYSSWNISYNSATKKVVSSANYNKTIDANSSSNVGGFNLKASSKEDIIRFMEMKIPVTVEYEDGSSLLGEPGLLLGADQADGGLELEGLNNIWTEGTQFVRQYKLKVKNNRETVADNWKVVLELPSNTHFKDGWNASYKIENNKLIITSNESWNIEINGQSYLNSELQFQLLFDSEDKTEQFLTMNKKLYFGNYEAYNSGEGSVPSQTPSQSPSTVPSATPSKAPLLYLNTQFKTDNFLGQMNGDAFVGGFLGYNILVKSDEENVAKDIEQKLIELLDASDNAKESYAQKVNLVDDILTTTKVSASDITMYIKGDGETGETNNTLGMIKAKVYVGGVLGYNDAQTKLYIKNVKNTTPIIATETISYAKEQNGRTEDFLDRALSYNYAYAGGIMGKVSPNTTIENCYNTSAGTVTSQATYTGGICEINEGTILKCKVSTFGSTATAYVGGIAGLNKENALIDQCIIDDKTITALNVGGGICAENFGTIQNTSIKKARINVAGQKISNGSKADEVEGVAGCITAVNHGLVIIKTDFDSVTVRSNGNYVGGVIGINYGFLKNEKANADSNLLAFGGTSTVSGRKLVGGFIGYNKNVKNDASFIITNFKNKASITATRGFSGGIIGYNASGTTIKNCRNEGTVSATNAGNAGGITSFNDSQILNCTDFGVVSAPKGMCGGITAANAENGVISLSVVKAAKDDETLTFKALDGVGGITALNDGIVSDCTLKNIIVENLASSKESEIGIVCGTNNGTITFAASDSAIDNCIAQTLTNYSKVGGVTGMNTGSIIGAALNEFDLPSTVLTTTVRFKNSSANIASFGGVAGVNEGVIQNLSVEGQIGHNPSKTNERVLGSEMSGYGGIVGINGFSASIDGEQAIVSDCTFDGTVWAHGSGSAIANIGGIAGANYYGGEIISCVLGARGKDTKVWGGDMNSQYDFIAKLDKTKKSTTNSEFHNNEFSFKSSGDIYSYTYIGGISGINYGKIASCDNESVASTNTVLIESLAGLNGGITGINYEGGIVTGTSTKPLSTGDNWKVEAYVAENDMGTGGIIANSYSGQPMAYVNNYAAVSNRYNANSNAAGLIGCLLQNETPIMKINNCNNYAYILSSNRASGFISLNMFKGVTFTECRNYGKQRSLGKDNLIAGFIAYSQATQNGLTWDSCENHAELVHSKNQGSGSAAGFLAKQSGATSGNIVLRNCINTGRIISFLNDNTTDVTYTNGLAHGASFVYNCGNDLYMDNVRNYSNSQVMGLTYKKLENSGKKCVITNSLDANANSMYLNNNKVNGKTEIDFASNSGLTQDEKDQLSAQTHTQRIANALTPDLSHTNYYIQKTNKGSAGASFSIPIASSLMRELIVMDSFLVNGYSLMPADYLAINFANLSNAFYIHMSNNTLLRNNYTVANSFYQDASEYLPSYDTDAGNNTWQNNTRASLYKELDPKFQQFLYECNYVTNQKLTKPSGFKATTANDYYTITWEQVPNAYEYQVFYELYDSNNNLIYSNDTEAETVADSVRSYRINALDAANHYKENGGDGAYTVHVKVTAISAYHKLHETEANAARYDSDPGEYSLSAKILLPAPKFHVEIIEGNNMIAILDNLDEYESYKNVGIIKVQIGSVKTEISLDKGYSTVFSYSQSANTDVNHFAYADLINDKTIKNTYMTSTYTRYCGTLLGNVEFANTGIDTATPYQIQTSYLGFYGTTASDTEYRLVYNVKQRDLHTTAELVSFDEELGANVAYASGTLHTAARVGNAVTDFSSTLTGFDYSVLGQDVEVRTYPFACQNEVCYYGHYVKKNIKKEELKTLVDENYFDETGLLVANPIFDEEGNLKKGYTIRDNQDAKHTYDVYWSASLALYDSADTKTPYQLSKITYTLAKDEQGNLLKDDTGRNYYKVVQNDSVVKKDLPIQPKPDILKTNYPVIGTVNDHTSYQFVWDQNVNLSSELYQNAIYDLELFGVNLLDEEVLIATVNQVTDQSYTFVDTDNNWNYKKLILKVSRAGIFDENQIITVMPNTETEEFEIKLKHSAVAMPGVNLAVDKKTGAFDKNNLRYDISFAAISDETESAEIAGYLIQAYTVNGEQKSNITNFYAKENQSVATLNQLTNQGYVIENSDVLTATELTTEDYVLSGVNRTATIDLGNYASKEVVHIAIQTITDPKSILYSNSDFSDATEVEIQDRLETPFKVGDGCEMTYHITAADETLVTMEELNENGIALKLTNPNYTEKENGQYELAIAVYDQAGKALQDENIYATPDSVERNLESWSNGSLQVFASKTTNASYVMKGDTLKQASYTLKLNGEQQLSDYAGMYLKVAVRAITENKISSVWTDEDSTENNTVNYQWIPIPKVQISSPEVSLSEVSEEYSIEESDANYIVARQKMQIGLSKYADKYEITFIENSNSDGQDVISMTMEKDSELDQYALYCIRTSVSGNSIEYSNVLTPEMEKIKVPITESNYQINNKDAISTFLEVAYLNETDGFSIVLPDALNCQNQDGTTTGIKQKSNLITKTVTVDTSAFEELSESYAPSTRTLIGLKENDFELLESPIKEAAFELTNLTIASGVITGTDSIAFPCEVEKPVICEVQLLDESLTKIQTIQEIILAKTETQTGKIVLPTTIKEQGEKKTGFTYQIRFAYMNEETGIGEWSDSYSFLFSEDFEPTLSVIQE